jgi:hypothetical protein
MFFKNIKFLAHENYIERNKDILPIPIRLNIPSWYKKLKHTHENHTIKGCIPFLDSLTTGYLLKLPQDYYLEHNIMRKGKKDTGFSCSIHDTLMTREVNLNVRGVGTFHPAKQLGESPLVEKNKKLHFHKILNPWIIRTPPGYSCLFLPPMSNQDDRFSIIPAIVDTDSFEIEINFPFVVNGDKYDTLTTTLERGLPYVQVIPFKRDNWKMQIEHYDKETKLTNYLHRFKYLINNYKRMNWTKKSWK